MSDVRELMLSDVGEIVTGSTPSTSVTEFWNGEVPFYSPADFNGSVFSSDTEKTVTDLGANTGRKLVTGSIMVTCIGSIGKMAICNKDGISNQQINSIIPTADYDSLYVYYLVLNGVNRFVNLAPQTTIQIINKTEFGKFKFGFHDYETQQKIAKILSTVDNLIEKTQTLIDKYTAIKQGMMADLFTRGIDMTSGDTTNSKGGKLRPSVEDAPELYKQTELGWVPKEWDVVAIDKILDRVIDYRGKTPTKTDEGIPLLTAKNVRFGYVDPEPREFIAFDAYEQWMTRGIPKKGDVLFTTEAPLANVAQIESDERVAFAQRMIILQTNKSCDNLFFKHLLMSETFRKSIFSRGSGSTVEGVKQSEFKKVLVKVPKSIEEQKMIVSTVESVVAKISTERKANKKYKEQKKGLMQDLLTGIVRVN
jgi:type I restriction enzyme S subunit